MHISTHISIVRPIYYCPNLTKLYHIVFAFLYACILELQPALQPDSYCADGQHLQAFHNHFYLLTKAVEVILTWLGSIPSISVTWRPLFRLMYRTLVRSIVHKSFDWYLGIRIRRQRWHSFMIASLCTAPTRLCPLSWQKSCCKSQTVGLSDRQMNTLIIRWL